MKNLAIRGPHDACAAVPQLLGFTPKDSLVLVVEQDGVVEVTARVDLPAEPWPELEDRLAPMVTAERRYLLFCYVDDTLRAEAVLGGAVLLVGEARVLDALHVAGDQFRRFQEQNWHRLNTANSQWALLSGAAVFSSRAEVAARVAGPEPMAARACERACVTAERQLVEAGADLALVVDDLLTIGLVDVAAIDEDAAAVLIVCLNDQSVRHQLVERFSADTASAFLKLFLALVERASQHRSGALLGLVALAAWLSGEGVLQVCAIERGLELCPNDSLLQLAAAIAQRCIPPHRWKQLLDSALGETEAIQCGSGPTEVAA